jgi:hypothetical protein
MLHVKQTDYPKKRMVMRGSVVENIRGLRMDASCYLQLDADRPEQIKVIYHSEFPPTANFYGADIGFELQRGDYVEIFAEVVDDHTLTICNATDYYIRLITN